MELPPLGTAPAGRGGLPRREALGLVLAFLLLLGGRWLRRRFLLGPDGRWRDDLWAADLLADDPAATAAEPPPKPVLTAPLPVNTCSEDSLTLLPGVGPKLAARIAAARREGGPFRDAADLQRVKGIGPALAGRLGPLVVFGPGPAPAAPPPPKSP